MKSNIWIPMNLAKLVMEHGNVFPLSIIKKELDFKPESVSEFLTKSREMELVSTKRREDDLRTVNIIVNKKNLDKKLLEMKKKFISKSVLYGIKKDNLDSIISDINNYFSHGK